MIFKSRSQFTTGSFRDTENSLANMLCHRPYSYWNYTELANSRKLWADCLCTSEWLDPHTHTGAPSLIPVRNISSSCKTTFRAQCITTFITQIKTITSYVASTNIWTNKHNAKRFYIHCSVHHCNCLKNNQHDVTCGLSFIFMGSRHSLSTCFELSGSRTRRRTGGLQQRL